MIPPSIAANILDSFRRIASRGKSTRPTNTSAGPRWRWRFRKRSPKAQSRSEQQICPARRGGGPAYPP